MLWFRAWILFLFVLYQLSFRFPPPFIFGNFCVGPTTLQRGLQGSHTPCISRYHPKHHPLVVVSNHLSGPQAMNLAPFHPLLPGLSYWPKVWPPFPWAPPESAPQICPISEQFGSSWIAYLLINAYSVVPLCLIWLIHVHIAYLYLNYPLWVPF